MAVTVRTVNKVRMAVTDETDRTVVTVKMVVTDLTVKMVSKAVQVLQSEDHTITTLSQHRQGGGVAVKKWKKALRTPSGLILLLKTKNTMPVRLVTTEDSLLGRM